MRAREAALRAEVGGAAPAVPRLTVARLRDLAACQGQAASALATLKASTADARDRLPALGATLADAPVAERLPELVRAVDDARALGGDLDARCEVQAAGLAALEAQARAGLAALSPWSGTVETVAR